MTQERFTPQMYVEYYASQRGISVQDIDVAPVVVISWGRGVIESLAEAVGAQPSLHWFYDEYYKLFTGEVGGQTVSFAHAPVGAPGTVMMMEEMIACGARIFLGLGWAGSLQELAPVGTMFIPTGCIRDEGTSFHYLGEEVTLAANERLVGLLESVARAEGAHVMAGRQWTTDAPYRELIGQIAAYREQGVLGVDMETSAMYALGLFRKVRVCNLLVVSDELWGKWRPAFRTAELQEATELAQRVILKCLAHDLSAAA
jgi:uridine phosphorylase